MIENTIKTMIAAAGKNSVTIANEIGITRPNMTHYVKSDFSQLKRFLLIAKLCNFDVIVTNKKGININIVDALQENNKKEQMFAINH